MPTRPKTTTRTDYIPRRELAKLVIARMDALGLNREQAAKVVGDAATQISRLYTGHIEEFSSERLIKMLLRLGCDVRIEIGPASAVPRRKATIIELSSPPSTP